MINISCVVKLYPVRLITERQILIDPQHPPLHESAIRFYVAII